MTWAAVLTRGTEWFEPVVWAAACHDLRRQDDGQDPDHGFRAGAWVRNDLPTEVAHRLPELELIATACDWHVCPDRNAGWSHPVLWLLKDADGLDRVRLYDLDVSYLRHAETRRWVSLATKLYEATAEDEDADHVWQVAGDLGIPVAALADFVRTVSRFPSGVK
jgi:hypothetical protein